MKLHWGNAIVIFFAIFLTLAAIFIVFSFRQHNDLVDDDYYDKGAAYSKQMEINERSKVYTDSIKIADSEDFIELKLSNDISKQTQEINLHFFRPSDKSMDIKYSFETNENPILIGKKDFSTGRYIVKISWIENQKNYYLEKELFVN